MLPCVWVFQKRRRAKDYIRVLEALKKAARVNKIRLSPEEVMIDFEIAAKIAFESVFDVKVIGCLFHFGQSLFKKLCAVGLKQSYIDNKDIQVSFVAQLIQK
jgi:hypothetical protein